MECVICGTVDNVIIHKGVRDNNNINVLKCKQCGMTFLDSKAGNTNENYIMDKTRNDVYSALEDKITDIKWEEWIKNSEGDDERRSCLIKPYVKQKTILDFGCGAGGFLRKIRGDALKVTGVELSGESYSRLNAEGIHVVKNIEDIDEEYDIITSFHVIEHINEPDNWIELIKKNIKKGGLFFCETPNADDALLSKYNCQAFADFTYWSNHVYLYNSSSLETLLKRHGFKLLTNTQIMRYNIANHLYWLSNGKPGGGNKYTIFNNENLVYEYDKILINEKIADTLWCCAVLE